MAGAEQTAALAQPPAEAALAELPAGAIPARVPGPEGPAPRGDLSDPVVAGALNVVGGPPGRHALLSERRFWTPARWILLVTLVFSLFGWVQKAPCHFKPWVDNRQYVYLCYTDVYALYFAEGLNVGKTPYLEHPVEYPLGIGVVMEVANQVTEALPKGDEARQFYTTTWVILTAFALLTAITTMRLAGRRPWDAMMFAAAPLLILHGTTNWDLVAVGLTGAGLLAWSRKHPWAAGVLLGLAAATKLYPVILLIPLLALCWRAGKLRAGAVTAACTLAVPVLLAGPVYLVSPYFAEVAGQQQQVAGPPLQRLGAEGLAALTPHKSASVEVEGGQQVVEGVNASYRFFELNKTRGADWDSIWYILQERRGKALDENLAPGASPTVLNAGVAGLLILAMGGVVWICLAAPRRPRLAQVLFLALLAFLLTNKVWSPQFSIWLLPLAILARPRWGMMIAWGGAEALVLFTRYYFFISRSPDGGGIGVRWFHGAVLLRDIILISLAVLVIREIWNPALDVVRRRNVGAGETGAGETGLDVPDPALDDPAGGVLAGAPDRHRLGGLQSGARRAP